MDTFCRRDEKGAAFLGSSPGPVPKRGSGGSLSAEAGGSSLGTWKKCWC